MTRSIFKLEHHSEAQNVASSMANVIVWLEYQYIAYLKNRQNYKMAAILKIFNVSG